MQIFLISEHPIEIAMQLDWKRLNKQVLECDWIIDGWKNKTRAINHPIAKMYKDNLDWVEKYKDCLKNYRDAFGYNPQIANDKIIKANKLSNEADEITPYFLKDCNWYFDNFKKRLYTKDKEYYKIFENYGESYSNWYFFDGEWHEYKNNDKK